MLPRFAAFRCFTMARYAIVDALRPARATFRLLLLMRVTPYDTMLLAMIIFRHDAYAYARYVDTR